MPSLPKDVMPADPSWAVSIHDVLSNNQTQRQQPVVGAHDDVHHSQQDVEAADDTH